MQPAVLTTQCGGRRSGSGTSGIALETRGQRKIQRDGHDGTAVPARHTDELGTCPILDVGGVHDGEAAAAQAHGQDAVEQFKGVVSRLLRGRIISDQRPQRI